MVMSLKVKQMTATGAAVVGIGSMSLVSPAMAYAQPLRISPPEDFTCPDSAGLQYLPDPDDAQAYYVCADGKLQDHQQCRPGANLDLNTTPPECLIPNPEDYPVK